MASFAGNVPSVGDVVAEPLADGSATYPTATTTTAAAAAPTSTSTEEAELGFEHADWSDVVPVPQDDGPAPIVSIEYDPNYRQMMDIFRAVLASGEVSGRVLGLTRSLIGANPANYTVWQYRRRCLFDLHKDLTAELDFMDAFADDNPKNYQIWHHRRAIAEVGGDGRRELAFTAKVFDEDAKNYHAWTHRQWVLQRFGDASDWDNEIKTIENLLEDDIRNNSVWNQRWFVVHRGPVPFDRSVFDREVDFALTSSLRARDNESSWTYLRALLVPLVQRSASGGQAVVVGAAAGQYVASDSDVISVLDRLVPLCGESFSETYGGIRSNDRHMYSLVAELSVRIGGATRLYLAEECYRRLGEELDVIRSKYWSRLRGEVQSRIAAVEAETQHA